MVFVKAARDALLRPLQVVSGIVERRQTLPILANVLVRKDGEKVAFTATDLEIQIQTSAEVGSGKETMATTVSARKLVDILRALPEADVTLALANKKLTLQSAKSRFALQTLSADEFPTVAIAEFSADFTLPAATLKYLLSMVHFAMAAQDIRYYLNGMLLVVDGEIVRAVATDGHRLALCEVSKSGEGADQSCEQERGIRFLILGPETSHTIDDAPSRTTRHTDRRGWPIEPGVLCTGS